MKNVEANRQYDNELQVLKDIKKLHNSKGMIIFIWIYILLKVCTWRFNAITIVRFSEDAYSRVPGGPLSELHGDYEIRHRYRVPLHLKQKEVQLLDHTYYRSNHARDLGEVSLAGLHTQRFEATEHHDEV